MFEHRTAPNSVDKVSSTDNATLDVSSAHPKLVPRTNPSFSLEKEQSVPEPIFCSNEILQDEATSIPLSSVQAGSPENSPERS